MLKVIYRHVETHLLHLLAALQSHLGIRSIMCAVSRRITQLHGKLALIR